MTIQVKTATIISEAGAAPPDDVGIELSSGTLSLKNGGVTGLKYANSSISAGKMKPDSVGTSNIIDANVTAAKLAAGVGGNLILVESKVLGADAQSVEFTGLDIATDGFYFLLMKGQNNAAGATNISLELNSDTTVANYYNQSFHGNAASITSSRVNSNVLSTFGSGDDIYFKILFSQGLKGFVTCDWAFHGEEAANVRHRRGFLDSAALGNLTTIKLVASLANAFKSGSVINLYKIGG